MLEGRSVTRASGKKYKGARQGTPHTSPEPVELPDRTLACRYEMKYHITETQAAAITEFIKPFVQLDRYCKLQPSRDYPIVSMYLDSGDLRLCRESLTGHKNRFKLRIRSYTDEPEYPRFFEIKRRMNTIIIKSRARVMDPDVDVLLAGLPLPPQNYTADIDTINQFQLYASSIRAKPTVLVRYMRQAYEGDGQNRVRVTFDRDLAYNITNAAQVRLGGGGWQRNPFTMGGVILEIKFTDRYPAWLGRLVRHFNLRTRSISKYASSLQDSCALKFCAPEMMA
ncbi:MAG TPA: polyphosphate polymerase domain-containing protein [Phycisphaerales bacterium]|nr:polyphosphate polymerase domain-containing protein [Phycisphaerales bacterium]